MRRILNCLKDRRGASAAEYVLLLAVLGAGVATGAVAYGTEVANAMRRAGEALEVAFGGPGDGGYGRPGNPGRPPATPGDPGSGDNPGKGVGKP